MNISKLLSFIFTLIFLSTSNSYSDPLYGTYTVGNGGDYQTINSAINDAQLLGISGPVIFDIITGIYNDTVVISGEYTNYIDEYTITLKSQSSVSSDVMITGGVSISGSSYIYIKDLSFNSDVDVTGKNIYYINNDFHGHSFTARYYSINSYEYHNYNLIDNHNLMNASFLGFNNFPFGGTYSIRLVKIKNNFISGRLTVNYCLALNSVENNIIGNGVTGTGIYPIPTFIGNKIIGNVYLWGPMFIGLSCNFYNNFILGSIITESGRFVNNTIVNNSIDSSTVYFASVLNTSSEILNNIFINLAGGNVVTYGGEVLYIYNLNCDYNVYYNGGNDYLIMYGTYNGTPYNNVRDFYIATGLDQHTTSQPVSFVSPTDLHLAASSYGDYQLIGTPNDLITDDIDGELRNSVYPYKGADEILDYPLPVELVSFSSIVTNNSVHLNWVTTSEINNTGFDIERSSVNIPKTNEWLKVGFVQGNGTSSITNIYEFTDKNLNPGKYSYRLKQIDFNGNFNYYNLSEEVIVGVPEQYSLSQNYPNPFNPTTVISYQIPSNDYVLLKIYDVNGKEVMTLVNEFKEAGSYEIKFNGNNFASGVYYYQIESRDFKATKKMFLVK